MQETLVLFLGREDPLEKGNDTHSSILAWRIGQRVGQDSVTFTILPNSQRCTLLSLIADVEPEVKLARVTRTVM